MTSNIYADRLDMFGIMAAQVNNPSDTHRITCWQERKTNKHTEHKLHVATYNRIAQPYIVPNTSWSLKTKATIVAHILTIQSLNLLDTCASTHVVYPLSEFLQIALTCSQSYRQDNPLKCGPEFHNDTNRWTQSPKRKTTSIRSKYRSSRHAKDFQHWQKCQTHHGE